MKWLLARFAEGVGVVNDKLEGVDNAIEAGAGAVGFTKGSHIFWLLVGISLGSLISLH